MSDRARTLAAVAIFVTLLAGTTAPPALFVVLRSALGWSAADVGLVFAAYVMTLLPLLFLYGRIADRVGRRGSAALGVTAGLAGLLAFMHSDILGVAIAARLAQGVAIAVASGSLTAAISQSHRGSISAAAVTTIASNLGLMLGALVTATAFDLTHSAVAALVPLVVATLAVTACIPLLPAQTASSAGDGTPFPAATVTRALAFALPVTFVGWSGVTLFLAMVPSYLAAALGLHDPLVGAGAIAMVQIASMSGTLVLRTLPSERAGVAGPLAVVVGLVVLVLGVGRGGLAGGALIVVATALVGAGGGIAFAAGLATVGRVSRGQRARLFAWLYVAAYLGFGIPSWLVGALAARSSFAQAFATIIIGLAVVTITLPFLARAGTAPPATENPAA